jgi:hypothetical protein
MAVEKYRQFMGLGLYFTNSRNAIWKTKYRPIDNKFYVFRPITLAFIVPHTHWQTAYDLW